MIKSTYRTSGGAEENSLKLSALGSFFLYFCRNSIFLIKILFLSAKCDIMIRLMIIMENDTIL